ncbi:MAG: alpha-L-arabinofuranosidase [Myxococcales bacterium]|nr:MAG: alpha-L-arabinofuranosidase [Myxococcales bacterium]
MQRTVFGLAGTLALATLALAAGCSSDSGPNPGTGGSASTGGTGQAGTGTGQSGSGAIPVPSCEGATACGGSVVGTWQVASSCLKLSGDLDTTLLSLGCHTVPVTGTVQVTGTLIANADGTYTDNTTTTSNAKINLSAECLTISSVAVSCDRLDSVLSAAGWDTIACTPNAQAGCDCELTAEQKAGLGIILPFADETGRYTTADTTLKLSSSEYAYCGTSSALTLTPKASALSGSIVLTHDGGGGGQGTGGSGAGGQGGSSGGVTGGAGGQGGAAGGQGGSPGGQGGTGGSGGSGGSPPVGNLPCDIYGAANNTCVAAHSTTRALLSAYSGALYQVKRADGMTKDIPVKSPGGYADSAQQDTFCAGTTCTIWRIYDQSGHGNFLEAETPESTVKGAQGMKAASATAESLTISGNKVYSVVMRSSMAYWRDGSKTGIPLGTDPEGMYMVSDGTTTNGGCCFDYGNAQLSRKYEGGPTMDAIYFGKSTQWGSGKAPGPWVMADMEDGMLSGKDSGHNENLPSMPYKFVTAILKNDGMDFALRGADATKPTLQTFYEGPLPAGKRGKMKKQGAIVLGSGGDCCLTNNNLSAGTFYEGAMVTGYPSAATEDAVQKNIADAGYGK